MTYYCLVINKILSEKGKEVDYMTDEKKKTIKETVAILVQLDTSSLLLIKNGADLLKARQDIEAHEKKTA